MPVVKLLGQGPDVESNCTKYYQCLAEGYLKVACSNEFHWNQGIMGCDWPANAGCDPSAAQSQGENVRSKLVIQWSDRVVPGFKALGLSMALRALNPGSALNSRTISLS